ncbi:MAG: hypothetical protein H6825_13120 [Planctomycetes bacterium]|nr:hypothetical protein [Planctomycetota bacterium]
MHYLTRQRLHLSRFHPLMKLLLSLYVLSVVGGLWVAGLKYSDRAEWTPRGAGAYVAGEPNVGAEAAAEDPFGDPFGGTPDGVMAREGLSRRQLVDIAHPHLFTLPLVLFVLCHLAHLTRLPDVAKGALDVAAFVSFGATFGAPFVLDDPALLGPVLYAAGTTLLVSCVLLCAIVLWETWLGRPGDGFDALPKPAPRRTSPGDAPRGE